MSLFDTVITQPIFNLLLTIYNFVGDFGIAIIIFTILVKIILWPMTRAQLSQTKAMRKMQPELDKIKRNAKGNKQLESVQMMELYKKHDVKPFRSLLVLFIQLPILLTLNSVINVTVNKSHEISNFTYSIVGNLSRVSEIIQNPDDFTPHLFGVVDLSAEIPNKTPFLFISVIAFLPIFVSKIKFIVFQINFDLSSNLLGHGSPGLKNSPPIIISLPSGSTSITGLFAQ